VALLVVVGAGLAALFLPGLAREALRSRLARFFGRPVEMAELRVHVFPPRVVVRDLRVGGPSPSDPPFLEVARLVFVPSLRPLWERRTVLSALEVYRPRIRVRAHAAGGDDLPTLRAGPTGGLDVRLGRLLVVDGELLLDHERVPLDLDLPTVEGRLASRGGRTLGGPFRLGPGPVRFGRRPTLEASVEMDLLLEGGTLQVGQGRVRTPGTDLRMAGRFELAPRPRGDFLAAGSVDLAVIDRHVVETGFAMKGAGHFDGSFSIAGSRLGFRGRLSGVAGEFDGVGVPAFDGQVGFDGGALRLSQLALQTLGGAARVDLDLPPAPGATRLQADLDAVDAEGLARAVFDLGPLGLGAAATGRLDLAWPRGRVRDLTGQVALSLAERGEGRTPAHGRLDYRAVDGLQRVQAAEIVTPDLGARVEGHIARDGGLDLDVDLVSGDLASFDDLAARTRRAVGQAAADPVGLGGSGAFRGRVSGTLDAPVFAGRFRGDSLHYLDVDWGRAEWAGRLTTRDLTLRSLVLRRGAGEIWLDGLLETGFVGEDDAVDLRARLRDWPAADLVHALGWEPSLEGSLSGEASIHGRRSQPLGEARIRAGRGSFYGQSFEALEADAVLRGSRTIVHRGEAGVGGGRVSFRGTLTQDALYDGEGEAAGVDVGSLFRAPAAGVEWGGRLFGQGRLEGPLVRPRLEARVSSPGLFLGDEGIGRLEAEARGEGDGRAALRASARSARVDVALAGEIEARPPHQATLEFRARDTSLDPVLRALWPALPGAVGLVLGGEVGLSGPLGRPSEMRGRGRLAGVEVLLPFLKLSSPAPASIEVAEGGLRLPGLRLQGEGSDIALHGAFALLPGGPLQLEVEGTTDLRAVSVMSPELRGRGSARLALSLVGTRRAPTLEGRLDVADAGLRVRGFPHGLENLRGSLRLSERSVVLQGVSGTLGGGPVEIEGQASFGPGGASFDVQAVGRGLALRYPEGLRSLLDGELRLSGDARKAWLTGEVAVRQAVWTRRYDLAAELLGQAPPDRVVPGLDDWLNYDVKLVAPGTLRVDNNLASLEARADLGLQGSRGAPVILGHAEIDRGRLYFQGNTYEVTRGVIDFTNPRQTEPIFDVEAETRIQSYRITLKLSGTLDRVTPTLQADDPTLSSVQILSLLAGADEATVQRLATTQRGVGQTRVAQAGAATLFGGVVSEKVERGAALLGLDRFSIDPALVRSDITNSNPRLTVGKRITPRVSVVYSQDLRGTEEQLVLLEYLVSDRISLLLTRAEPGGFGFDVRLRQSR
jgi:hypothetical protein